MIPTELMTCAIAFAIEHYQTRARGLQLLSRHKKQGGLYD